MSTGLEARWQVSLMMGSPATSTEVERKDMSVEMRRKVTLIFSTRYKAESLTKTDRQSWQN